MKITICGSMSFAKEMMQTTKMLENYKHTVYYPGYDQEIDLERYKEAGNTEESVQRKINNNYIRTHFYLIQKSDCILVLNYDKRGIKGYIGANTFLELGFAHVLDKKIFLLQNIPENSYMKAELLAMQPIILNNDLTKIT